MICIDEEIPFEIPTGWEWTKVNEIAFVTKLAGFEYSEYIASSIMPFNTKAIPLFKGKNIQNSTIIYNFESYIPEVLSDQLERSQITKKCLLTPYVGTIGNIGLHNKEGKYHLGSNVGKIEFFNNSEIKILEEYAHIYLLSCYGYAELTKHKKATAQESISIEAIRDVYFPLPPLGEQHRIVEKVEQVLPFVDEYNKAQSKLDDLNKQLPDVLKKSILQEAIQGKLVPQDHADEPASVLLDRIKAEKSRLIKEKKIKRDKNESIIFKGDDNSYYEKNAEGTIQCIDDELPFELPKTWSWCRLGYLCKLIIGKTPARGDCDYWSNATFPWVSISDMKDYGTISSTKECVSQIAATKAFNGKLSKAGSLLMSFKLTVGRTSILDIDAFHNEAIITVQPFIDSDNSLRDYLFRVLPVISNWGDSKDAIKGKTLNSTSLYNILVPLPPVEEAKRICDKVKTIFAIAQ